MIYRLQKKFILICALSVLAVILLVFALMTAFNVSSMNRNLDILADSVSAGGGRFPDRGKEEPPHKAEKPADRDNFDFITPETPFSTRHFTVWFDREGAVARVNTESIHSVTDEGAEQLALKAAGSKKDRGWLSSYRYKVYDTEGGRAVVFIDGSMSRAATVQSITISAAVLLSCAALVLLMIILLSKRAVKPIAESYERQRQFVTDANHELKTPLTLILANLDIAEGELGHNEWLDDIRTEGHRMTELVNQLVALSRMDEEQPLNLAPVDLGETVADVVSDFRAPAESSGKRLEAVVGEDIHCLGDESLLRRLLSILLDNAIKYCDEGGEISLRLERRRHILLTVENSYAAVGQLELNRLFDRFYRADPARTFTGGYGIGLSIAKAIAEQHKGDIAAYKKDNSHIGFKVTLKI